VHNNNNDNLILEIRCMWNV